MSERESSRALLALSLSFFAMGTASLSAVGALDTIAAALAVSRARASALVPAFALTFAIGAPLLQLLGRNWIRRRVLLVGLAILCVGLLGCAAAGSFTLLLAARVLTGVGAAAVSSMVSAVATAVVPPQRQGHALAVAFSGITLASVLGVPLASWCAALVGWRCMFVGIALLGALAFALVRRWVRDDSRTPPVGIDQMLQVARHRGVVTTLATTLLCMTALFTTYTMIAPLLRDRFGAGADGVSVALFVYGAAGLAGNGLARRVALAWSAERSVGCALGLLIAGLAVFRLSPGSLPLAVAALVPWAIAVDIFAPAQQRRLVELMPEMRGLVLALNSSCLFAGMAVGGALAGRLVAGAGLDALAPVSIALAVTCLALLRYGRRAVNGPDGAGASPRATG